nr:PREDICTED: cysteine-rich DPF motif domain-containing protein 1 [Tribolium castaneum]|eukprot:XP_008195524.1 PREDICTED: cysteine-rich DPF motif domain-containing protein 1 [Tribolium castaneum]
MDNSLIIKTEPVDPVPSTSKESEGDCSNVKEETPVKTEAKVEYFHCEICALHERYDYFGNSPPFVRHYRLLENAYVIEDPFVPPKQNEFIILGSHCVKCGKSVCKDINCSFYYDGTHCIHCAKSSIDSFPPNVQQKINKIIV